MKAIAIAVYNRPRCFDLLIQSLKQQILPLDAYLKIVSVDRGGNHFTEMVDMATSFADIVMSRKQHLGLNQNTFAPVREAFEVQEADQVVYLEEDFILSPDAFNLVEWYIDNTETLRVVEGVKDVAVCCLCRCPRFKLETVNDPSTIWLSSGLQGWGFVISARQYHLYVKHPWSDARLRSTWDKRLANHIRTFPGVYNTIPSLSRILNTGRAGGTSVQGRKYDMMTKGMIQRTSREVVEFHLGGISDLSR